MMKALFTADLHLTSRPVDAYRLEVFHWLKKEAINRGVDYIFILGDLTDAKDAHNSRLVNRLVDELVDLSKVCPIRAIKGNHDYVDESTPFFKFINEVPNIRYFVDPEEEAIDGKRILYLPHSKNYKEAWRGWKMADYDFILLHQPFIGSIGDNGYALPDGASTERFSRSATDAIVLAGDIHTPQEVDGIIYCGAPYPVHFGDHYQPRVIFYEDGRLRSIKRHSVRKLMLKVKSLKEFEETELHEDDQVRITVQLLRRDFDEWPDLKQKITSRCEEKKVLLCGLSLEEIVVPAKASTEKPVSVMSRPSDVLSRFCSINRIDDEMKEAGLGFLTVD